MLTLRTFTEFGFVGEEAFRQIISRSEYGDLLQLVASLTVFSHPITVRPTENRNLFPVIRRRSVFRHRAFFTLRRWFEGHAC